MRRAAQVVVRSVLIGLVLFPAWVSYVVPWIRTRRFGAEIDDAVWDRKHRKYARRFYRLAVRLRGGLIKVGQILSTRVDLLPPGWTEELAGLQDEVEPLPWERVEPYVTESYGRSPDELFESLEHEAVAAASFGQVHRGETKDGVAVALKIRYPDAELKLGVDMWLFGIARRLFNLFIPKVDLAPIYFEVRRALFQELDYEEEARYTRTVHEHFEGREGVVIPRVIDELTTRTMICTTWFEGDKITKASVLEAPGLDREKLLERLLWTWIQMMYVDGVFQSDPHPGNLLVRVDEDGEPTLCVVDFGQVKILSQEFHQKLVRSVMAFAMGNEGMFMDSLVEIGLFPDTEKEKFQPIVTALMKRLRDERPAKDRTLDFMLVRDEVLSTLDEMDGIVIPQELVLYGRTFALLAGVSRSVAPDSNPLAIAQPILTQALLAGGPPA